MTAPKLRRKRHRNSKLGCNNCKRRKVKCLETLPQCTNCIKHRLECDYLHRTEEELAEIRLKHSNAQVPPVVQVPPPPPPPPLYYPPVTPNEYIPLQSQFYPQFVLMNPMTLYAHMPMTSFPTVPLPQQPLAPTSTHPPKLLPTMHQEIDHVSIAAIPHHLPSMGTLDRTRAYFSQMILDAYSGNSLAFTALLALAKHMWSIYKTKETNYAITVT